MKYRNQFLLLLERVVNQDIIKKKKYRGKIFSKDAPTGLYRRIVYRIDEIKNFFYRGLNGYYKWQPYDIRSWFAINVTHLLHDMLLDLHGHPYGMSYDEWKEILTKMYENFKNSLNETETDIDTTEDSIRSFKEGLKSFTEYYFDLWD